MKTTGYARQSGFTLLELSVVIVIISLIIGALAGIRVYTRNAELSNTMNESKFYTDAFNKFQAQYGGPPGDLCATSTSCGAEGAATTSLIWTTAPNDANNGDGNGVIRAAGTLFPSERYYAWRHLALGGFIPGKYSGAANGSGGASLGVNVPSASMKGVGFIFDHPAATDGVVSTDSEGKFIDGIYPNVLIVAGSAVVGSTIPSDGFLTPRQALQLDEKYDDGRAGTGNITPPKNSGTCTDVDTTAAVYLTTTDAKSCYLIIKMSGT